MFIMLRSQPFVMKKAINLGCTDFFYFQFTDTKNMPVKKVQSIVCSFNKFKLNFKPHGTLPSLSILVGFERACMKR